MGAVFMAGISSTPDFTAPSHVPVIGEPAWDLALLYPRQGQWSESEYLAVTEGTNWLIELTEGRVEVLPIPTSSHQRILLFLFAQLQAFVLPNRLGEVLCAALRVKLGTGKFREPDVVFMLTEHRDRIGEEYWEGADLVMEIVSKDAESRKRDLVQKPVDYAEGGIPEYWIVDPQEGNITVLTLRNGEYQPHGVFHTGDSATSLLLEGFAVGVKDVFAAGKL
jgi:Uma2 family endonuclease